MNDQKLGTYLDENHPILNPMTLEIKTPMMSSIIDFIDERLFDFDSGGCLLGSHRIGKSTSVQIIAKELSERSKNPVYCHYFSADRLEKNTIKQMYEIFCYQEKIPTKTSAKGLDLRELIIHRLLDQLTRFGSSQIVVFIDEMHRLDTNLLDALASLHDIFRRIGVNLCLIFIGNTYPSRRLIDLTKLKANRLIYGRFFENQKHIYGIREKSELQQCLAQFDLLRYPIDGESYTQYFTHVNSPDKWKLASLTNLIWDVYKKQYWPVTKSMHGSWGMKYFVSTIRSLLVFYLNTMWTDDDEALRSMIHQCIARSGLLQESVRLVK